MSNRSILNLMILGSFVMAGLFYMALRKAPEYKHLVTAQMHTEFQQYAQQIKKIDSLKVAEKESGAFFVSFQNPWKFEIQDKVLVVTAPQPTHEISGEPLPPELLPKARKSVEDLIWSWIDDKFKTRKNIELKVRFAHEPSTPLPGS